MSLSKSGYDDAKITSLTKAALDRGFTHFKMKVGASQSDDLRRGLLIRSIIDNPELIPAHLKASRVEQGPNAKEVVGKNAVPTGCVLMIDANQVWEANEAVEWVRGLEAIRPWWVSLACIYWISLMDNSKPHILKALFPKVH